MQVDPRQAQLVRLAQTRANQIRTQAGGQPIQPNDVLLGVLSDVRELKLTGSSPLTEQYLHMVCKHLGLPNLSLLGDNVATGLATVREKAAPDVTLRPASPPVVPAKKFEERFPVLTSLGARDLSVAVASKLVDLVVDRGPEIDLALSKLGKQRRRAIALIGDHGVGKRSIVQGIAQRIAANESAASFRSTHVIQVSGAKLAYLAAAEGSSLVVEKLVREIETARVDLARMDVIPFITDINMLGAGGTDLPQVLADAIDSGALALLGSCSKADWKKSIANTSLAVAMAAKEISEPTPDETLKIVLAHGTRLGKAHGVIVDASAAGAAVEFGKLMGRQPVAPIDILDETASYVAQSLDGAAPEVRVLERTLRDTEAALAASTGEDERSERVRRRMTRMMGKAATTLAKVKAQAASEQEGLQNIGSLGKQLASELENPSPDAARVDAVRTQLSIARDLRSVLPRHLYHDRVDAFAVLETIARNTGRKVEDLVAQLASGDARIEEGLGRTVVGQHQAKKVLAAAVVRAREKMRDPNKPVGAHVFLGPSGVGKTQIVKAHADLLGLPLIKIDCVEMMEKHELAKLKGAPPGYAGFEAGSAIAEQVKRHKVGVVCFDEVEKAHPAIFLTIMQILDEGRSTDSDGSLVDWTGMQIVFCSNLGEELFKKYATKEGTWANQEELYAELDALFSERIPATVRNRFTKSEERRYTLFHPLSQHDTNSIFDIKFGQIAGRLDNERDIKLTYTDEAKLALVERGFNAEYGGRNLNETLTQLVEDPIAAALSARRFNDGALLQLVFSLDKGFDFLPISTRAA